MNTPKREGYILLQPQSLTYIALPASLAMQVMAEGIILKEEWVGGNQDYTPSPTAMVMKAMTHDQITASKVRHRIVSTGAATPKDPESLAESE